MSILHFHGYFLFRIIREVIGNNPPSSLVESYYSCVQGAEAALFDAFGISVGNASLAVQVFGVLALPLIYFLLQVRVMQCSVV